MSLPAHTSPQRPPTLQLIKPPHTSVDASRRPPQSGPTLPLATRFGLRLRALRLAKGKTQLQVAIEFGIDRTFLSDVERGRKSVSLPFLEIFALGFGLSLSDLLRGL